MLPRMYLVNNMTVEIFHPKAPAILLRVYPVVLISRIKIICKQYVVPDESSLLLVGEFQKNTVFIKSAL